jgi:hypothetical protein
MTTPLSTMSDAVEHLRKGWPQMAHIELMTLLETLPMNSRYYLMVQKAASWIDNGLPRMAIEELERTLNMEREYGTR